MEKCEDCGSVVDVEYCIEPYGQDIYDAEDWMWLCGECYYERRMNI